MSSDSERRGSLTPQDPKAELEDELIARAMEPYLKTLDRDEQAGMRFFLRAFVKTHPAMQSMIVRRLSEDAAAELAKVAASAVPRRARDGSGVVTRDAGDLDTADSNTRTAPDASGTVPKDRAEDVPRRGKASGGS